MGIKGLISAGCRQINADGFWLTPDRLRGRMTSVNVVFAQGGPQLGNLEAGIVASLLGAPMSVITGGIGTLIAVVIIACMVPELRNYG